MCIIGRKLIPETLPPSSYNKRVMTCGSSIFYGASSCRQWQRCTLCNVSCKHKWEELSMYVSFKKDQPKNVINLLKIRRLIVRGIIREGPWIPLGCQAFLALPGKYARHADNRGPSSEPCMPCVPRIPVAPLQVCLALNRTYLAITAGMHITEHCCLIFNWMICTAYTSPLYYSRYAYYWTLLTTGVYDSCIPIVSMPGIELSRGTWYCSLRVDIKQHCVFAACIAYTS